jgi:hypothetical protein
MGETNASSQRDATFEGWGNLDWKGRRERRFHRWLAATGVPFAGDSARQAYTERIQLFIDALALKKPARVPVNSVMGFYPTKFGGLSLKEAMYEFEKAGHSTSTSSRTTSRCPSPQPQYSTSWDFSSSNGRAMALGRTPRGSTLRPST